MADFYAAGLVSSAFALHYGCNGSIAVQNAQIPCDQVRCRRQRVGASVLALRRGQRPVHGRGRHGGLRGEGQPPAVRRFLAHGLGGRHQPERRVPVNRNGVTMRRSTGATRTSPSRSS